MQVIREKPCQRLHHRLEAPLYIQVGGVSQRATDWSLGGFRIDDFDGPLPQEGEMLDVICALPFQGFNISFEAEGRVVRATAHGRSFAAAFTHLGDRERQLMSHFVEELVRGGMVSARETIHRIDAPVTPVPTDPTLNPPDAMPMRRWPVKTIVMTALHLVLGLGVIGYSAVLFRNHFSHLEVNAAVVAAPLEAVTAQEKGRVSALLVPAGALVAAGEPLMLLQDSNLDRQITIAETRIDRTEAVVASLTAKLEEEKDRLRDYDFANTNDIRQFALEIRALEARVDAARSRKERAEALYVDGWTKKSELEQAVSALAAADAELGAARLRQRELQALASRSGSKRYYDGRRFYGDSAKLEAERRLAQTEVKVAEQELAALVRQRDRLAVRAPFDGRLIEIAVSPGKTIGAGDTVALLELSAEQSIEAYLNQREVLEVGLGDRATVYIPATGERFGASVERIDRTNGSVDARSRRYRWQSPDDRTALVALRVDDPHALHSVDGHPSGLPAVVVFPRRSANTLLAGIRQWLGGGEPKSVDVAERRQPAATGTFASTVE